MCVACSRLLISPWHGALSRFGVDLRVVQKWDASIGQGFTRGPVVSPVAEGQLRLVTFQATALDNRKEKRLLSKEKQTISKADNERSEWSLSGWRKLRPNEVKMSKRRLGKKRWLVKQWLTNHGHEVSRLSEKEVLNVGFRHFNYEPDNSRSLESQFDILIVLMNIKKGRRQSVWTG